MYTQEEILALQQREKELSEELRKIRKILNTRRSYERTYGAVRPYHTRKTPEELREYNRIKQREWRAKHKKKVENPCVKCSLNYDGSCCGCDKGREYKKMMEELK